ncbi:MAG: ABC transporter permease [Candidatus Paraimprobicoccus trichonymphae]|uniref:ABC transporter permease n=1 Tax=Candidatus Paraimprobicoccus trichonymphae TaxID=3033793 RepID=A0AA48KZ45_9FIRM|nr:MAG: ABC transporter permease [Candidatus Paraimprobicoccus trichonymphae]
MNFFRIKKINFVLIMLPYILWILLFIVIPMLLIVYYSFTNPEHKFTLENILKTGKFYIVFLKSIWLSMISTVICFILGYPMAYFISKTDEKTQNITIIFLMIPTWMSFLLRTFAWMTILENNGLLNSFLNFLHLPKLYLINTTSAVIIGMVYNFLPYMIIPITTVLSKISKNLIEAAQDLGANKFQILLKIIFPLSLPGIISGVTMVFAPAVSTFVISKMLGGGSNLLIGDLIEMQFLGNFYNPYFGSAISLILIIIIFACLSIMNKFGNKGGKNIIV